MIHNWAPQRMCERVAGCWIMVSTADHPCVSKILPHPHDPTQDALVCRLGEVFIPPVERMKNSLPAGFLELPYKGSFWATSPALHHHIVTRLTGKFRIDENDLAFAEERLHRIVSYL